MSFYADDGSCQSRRIHGLDVEHTSTPPTNANAFQSNITPAEVIPNFGTMSTQYNDNNTQEYDLLDLLSEDTQSLATQSFRQPTQPEQREAVLSPLTVRQTQDAPSPSSGTTTSVFVQADPPSVATQPPQNHSASYWQPNNTQYPMVNVTPNQIHNPTHEQQVIQQNQIHLQSVTEVQQQQATMRQDFQVLTHRINSINKSMTRQYSMLMDKLNSVLNTHSAPQAASTSDPTSNLHQTQVPKPTSSIFKSTTSSTFGYFFTATNSYHNQSTRST